VPAKMSSKVKSGKKSQSTAANNASQKKINNVMSPIKRTALRVKKPINLIIIFTTKVEKKDSGVKFRL
jgi:hypothetical protein